MIHPKTVFPPKAISGLISISTTGYKNAPLEDGWDWIYRLKFDDVDGEQKGYVPFNKVVAQALAGAIKERIDHCDFLIVHCDAGISRSPAIVVAILEYFTGDKQIYKRYPNYNRLVYKLIMEALHGCDGR